MNRAVVLAALTLPLACVVPARAWQPLPMDLQSWAPQPLPGVERQTRWQAQSQDGMTTLAAQSDAAASGLIHAVDWPGQATLRWRWKVSRSVRGGRLDTRSADDFAARLYVIFDPPDSHLSWGDRTKLALGRKLFGDSLPRAALCYVWSHTETVGTIAPNAYTNRVRMIVLDQGDDQTGQWRLHERDLAADYEAAFGHAPAPRIIGVSLMSDTDNTGDSVQAAFAEIEARVGAAAGVER
jgi:hypothetical protein